MLKCKVSTSEQLLVGGRLSRIAAAVGRCDRHLPAHGVRAQQHRAQPVSECAGDGRLSGGGSPADQNEPHLTGLQVSQGELRVVICVGRRRRSALGGLDAEHLRTHERAIGDVVMAQRGDLRGTAELEATA
jgi:hypothetical protein